MVYLIRHTTPAIESGVCYGRSDIALADTAPREIAAVLEIATNEVERMLESIAERVRRKIAPAFGVSAGNPGGTYARATPRLA